MRRSLVTLTAAVCLLAGCTATDPTPDPVADDDPTEATTHRTVQPGAPGQPSRTLSAEEIAELDLSAPDLTETDLAFLQGMIVHHQQAVHMTSLVDERRGDPQLSLFAERMDISQRDEIDLMVRWLEEADAEVPTDDAHGDHADGDAHTGHSPMPMHGMLTADQLDALEAAEGDAFDTRFLEAMIEHHLGALAMVAWLYDEGGALNPDIARFADHVASDQHIEIARMRTMLDEADA